MSEGKNDRGQDGQRAVSVGRRAGGIRRCRQEQAPSGYSVQTGRVKLKDPGSV